MMVVLIVTPSVRCIVSLPGPGECEQYLESKRSAIAKARFPCDVGERDRRHQYLSQLLLEHMAKGYRGVVWLAV